MSAEMITARHELRHIRRAPIRDGGYWLVDCACGWSQQVLPTDAAARDAHDDHRIAVSR